MTEYEWKKYIDSIEDSVWHEYINNLMECFNEFVSYCDPWDTITASPEVLVGVVKKGVRTFDFTGFLYNYDGVTVKVVEDPSEDFFKVTKKSKIQGGRV